MTYDEAMALIHRNGRREVARSGAGFGVVWRFGRPMMLADRLGGGRRHIDYTPTREDMAADDWLLVDGPGGLAP